MRQKLGQHFLANPAIAERIVASADISPNATVLEIGPGKGAITALLLEEAAHVIALELDTTLAERLTHQHQHNPAVRVINASAIGYDYHALPRGTVVVSNLPYYAATPIIESLLPTHSWESAVVMVQKEVAERICAPVGTKAYGYFTILAQYYAETEYLFTVGPKHFNPPPQVDSAVIRLQNRRNTLCNQPLLTFIKECFSHRRKQMAGLLVRITDFEREYVVKSLDSAQIPHAIRPEKLTFDDFSRLFTILFTAS